MNESKLKLYHAMLINRQQAVTESIDRLLIHALNNDINDLHIEFENLCVQSGRIEILRVAATKEHTI